MAGDFQKQFNDALQEAELGDLKKSVDEIRGLNPKEQIRKHINPFEKAAADVRAGLDSLNKQPPKAADPNPHPAEPLKAGPVLDPELPAASAALASTPPVVAPPAPVVAETKAKGAPKKAAKAQDGSKVAAKKPAKRAKTSA
jgi:sec-independent protein translocase protein TatB